jgi:hypothetical protein
VIQHLREQGNQKIAVSSKLRSIEEIILKSDILKLGLDIPAVKKVTYAPAIDTERDKTEAEDDKRIPEELKKLAEKYSNTVSELEDKVDEDPMGDYFFAIGKEALAGKETKEDEKN